MADRGKAKTGEVGPVLVLLRNAIGRGLWLQAARLRVVVAVPNIEAKGPANTAVFLLKKKLRVKKVLQKI